MLVSGSPSTDKRSKPSPKRSSYIPTSSLWSCPCRRQRCERDIGRVSSSQMRALSALFSALLLLAHAVQGQPLTVDPESIVPLPAKFDMETPAPDVPPEIARFHGAWIGTWHDDRHVLVVERVRRDGHAHVLFAQSDSAFYDMNREWWRSEATITNGALILTGFRTFK